MRSDELILSRAGFLFKDISRLKILVPATRYKIVFTFTERAFKKEILND